MSESWFTAPVDTLTPNQARQRRLIEAEQAMRVTLGVPPDSLQLVEGQAIRALVDPESSIFALSGALDHLDRCRDDDMADWSNAVRRLPRLGSPLLAAAREHLNPRMPGPTTHV